VRIAGVALLIAIALVAQTTIARFLPSASNVIDVVFVVVVYVALIGGPVAGLLTGAIAGIAQDSLSATGVTVISIAAGVITSRSIVGIGGLAKSFVGFFTGILGSQFIVARPLPRAVVFFTATVAHAIIFLGLYSVLDPRYGRTPYASVFTQAGVNALIGVLLFQVSESFPGFMEKRGSMGGGMRIDRRLD
jgi:hypothetical protein